MSKDKNEIENEISNLHQKALQLHQHGQYKEAIASLAQLSKIIRENFGENNEYYAGTLRNLATVYGDAGEFGKAEPLLEKALEVYRQVLGEKHPAYATTLTELGMLHQLVGEYNKAKLLLEKALEVYRQALGEKHLDYADTLTSLALVYQAVGEYNKAEPLLEKALEVCRQTVGENNENYAAILTQLGKLHQQVGEYNKAEPLLEKALEVCRQTVGENNENYAGTLTSLASLYRATAEYNKAEPLLEKALEVYRQTVGEKHPAYAGTLTSLALVYGDAGEFGKAEPLLEKALEVYRQTVGEKHPWYADILTNLASLYRATAEYNKAEPLLEKALEVYRQTVGENNENYAGTLTSLALVYQAVGEYNKAEPLLEKALEVCRQVLGEKHPSYVITLTELGMLHQLVGEYNKAEPLFEKALEVYRQVLGEKHPSYARGLSNLASLYLEIASRRGKVDKAAAAAELSKAESLFEKALEVYRQVLGEKHPSYAFSLQKLAYLYLERLSFSDIASRRGKVDKAAAAAELSKAESLCERALEITRQVLGEKHLAYAATLGNLGSFYFMIGEYDKGAPLIEKALEVNRAAVSENVDPQSFRNAAVMYAMVCVVTSRQTKALHFLQESVSAEDDIIDKIFSFASEGQRTSFIKRLRFTFDLFLSLVFQQFSHDQIAVQSALDLVIRRKSIAAEAITVQREIVLAGKNPQLKSIVLELNNVRRDISLKSMAGPTRGETYDIHKKNLEELNSKRERLEKELARRIPEIRLQQSLKTTDSKTISNALPEDVLLIEIVKFGNLNFYPFPAHGPVDSQWYNWRYMAFILRAKEAENVQLIDLGNAEFIDKMITSFRMSIIEGGSNQTNQHLGYGNHLAALDPVHSSHHNNNPSWIDIGYDLYKQIFYPLLSAIGNCKNLFIAPDGDLSRLPFEVLPTSKDSRTHLLIDDYSITYLTTARDILQMNKVSDGLPNESIVVADPDFDLDSSNRPTSIGSSSMNNSIHANTDNTESAEEVIIGIPVSRRSRDLDRSTINFNRLVGTEDEGKEISKLLGVQPWTGERVLESRLKSSKSPKILHIATHGFFLANQEYDPNKNKDSTLIGITKVSDSSASASGNNIFNRLSGQSLESPMLRSGLALAGANTWIQNKSLREEAEDGILTAEDVSIMDLSNTELVVLSACETGLGEVLRGEGVFGLRRSFILAGAKTLVMSLWKVPDEQTKELMVDFYKRLLSGKPRAEGLREAQLTMKEKYPNPYYWGAFICQGNPGSIINAETRAGVNEDSGRRQLPDPYLESIEEAHMFLEKEQYDNAIKIFDAILILSPGHVEALNGKGLALCKQKKYDEALECFKDVLQIKPKHAEASIYVDMITDRISKERNADARPSGNNIGQDTMLGNYNVSADPIYQNPTLPAGYKAEDLRIKSAYEEDHYADPIYQNPTLPAGYKAHDLKITSNDVNAWNDRGLTFYNLGKYKEAIKSFDKALDIDPRDATILSNKGASLNNLGKYKDAIKCLDKALEIEPNNAGAWLNKGNALYNLRKHEEAIKYYDKALDIDPSFAVAWNNKGIALKKLGKDEDAQKCLEEAKGLGL
jgi:tetratricopeptide (TPR) repeat protein